jgi:hypothetical protein
MDVAKTAEHLSLNPEQVQAAVNYYAAYPDEIDQALQENDAGYERLKQSLPSIQLVEADLPAPR